MPGRAASDVPTRLPTSAIRRGWRLSPSIRVPEVPAGGIRVCFSGQEVHEPLPPELIYPQARLPVRMQAKAD
jgi:hypothetical protein